MGLLYLKVGGRLLLLPHLREHPWRQALLAAADGGLGRRQRLRLLRAVLLPLLWALCRLLALPYALGHGEAQRRHTRPAAPQPRGSPAAPRRARD